MNQKSGINNRAMIIAVLAEYAVFGYSQGMLAKTLNMKKSLVSYHLRKLEEKDMIYRTRYKTWQLNRFSGDDKTIEEIRIYTEWGKALFTETRF